MRPRAILAVFGTTLLLGSGAFSQEDPSRPSVPARAIRFDGAPPVNVESRRDPGMRRALIGPQEKPLSDPQEKKVGLFVGSKRRLPAYEPGAYTHLRGMPGQYIRIKPLNETLSYVERVDTYGERVDAPSGSVTWYGELRMVVKE